MAKKTHLTSHNVWLCGKFGLYLHTFWDFHRFLWFLWEHHVFFREHVPRTSEKSKKKNKKTHTQFSEDILWIEMKVPVKVIYTQKAAWSNETLSYPHCWMLCAWISHFNECQATYLHKQDVVASPGRNQRVVVVVMLGRQRGMTQKYKQSIIPLKCFEPFFKMQWVESSFCTP